MPENMFSLIFPLLYRYALNELLHPGSAVFPHLLCNVAVNVERKGSGGMTQIALHRLDVVPGLDRGDGICVPIGYNREQSEKPCNFNGLTTPKYSFSHDI